MGNIISHHITSYHITSHINTSHINTSHHITSRENLEATRRRRECLECKKRFTTHEKVQGIDLFVVKKDGRREAFNKEKLMMGIQKACEKRPVSLDVIEKTSDEIETRLRNMDSLEIEGGIIGDLVMRKLKKIDKIAYVRFASVYREFDDIEKFHDEVKKIVNA